MSEGEKPPIDYRLRQSLMEEAEANSRAKGLEFGDEGVFQVQAARNLPTTNFGGIANLVQGGLSAMPLGNLIPAGTLESLANNYLPDMPMDRYGNPDVTGPFANILSYGLGYDDPRDRLAHAAQLGEALQYTGINDVLGSYNRLGGEGRRPDGWDYLNAVAPFAPEIGRGAAALAKRTPLGRQVIDWLTRFDPLVDDVSDVLEGVYREMPSTAEIKLLSQELYDQGASLPQLNAVLRHFGTGFTDDVAADLAVRQRDEMLALPSPQGDLAVRSTARDMSPPPSVNVGLVVEPDMSGTGLRELLAPDEARQQLSDLGVNIRRDQVRASMTEPTLVAELDRALTPEEAFAVSQGLRQKAIAHVGPEGGALSGPLSEEWGTFNPEYYMQFADNFDNAPLVTDPFSARLVSEAQITQRLLRERALAEGQMIPVEGRTAGLNALNARNAEPYLAELPSEEALLRRLSGLGINVDTMGADWARSLAVDRLSDTPANPTSALGVHYSRSPDLTQTDPSFYGTGHRGEDYGPTRARGGANRTHFYIGADGRPVVPEPSVEAIAPYRYEADLEGMYDLDLDPDMLVALARAHQGRDIMTGAGYKPTIPGYMSQGQGIESGSAIPDVERLLQQYGYSGFLADFGSQRAAGMYQPVNVRRTP